MSNSKNLHSKCNVHRIPRGMQAIHKNYGLWILSTGNCKTGIDSFIQTEQRYFEFFSLSHMYKGKGALWVFPDDNQKVDEGDCILMPPLVVNRYGGAYGAAYEEDSICFTGPLADMLYRSGIIKSGVFKLGKGRELLSIQKMASDPARDSQINANIALQNLLIDIYNKNRELESGKLSSQSTIQPLITTLKKEIHRWWTVEEMAEFCGLSKDQFRRVFKKETGMLPKIYLDKLKLHKAAEMLMSTNDKISKIAASLDYHDAYHFSRRFKDIIGFSPKQYRLEFGSMRGQ